MLAQALFGGLQQRAARVGVQFGRRYRRSWHRRFFPFRAMRLTTGPGRSKFRSIDRPTQASPRALRSMPIVPFFGPAYGRGAMSRLIGLGGAASSNRLPSGRPHSTSRPPPDLSWLHPGVLGNAAHDRGPPAVRRRDHRVHLHRHLLRGARPDRALWRRVSAVTATGADDRAVPRTASQRRHRASVSLPGTVATRTS